MYGLGLAHSLYVCCYFLFFVCVLLYDMHFHNLIITIIIRLLRLF